MALPRMIRIKQHFDAPVVADLPAAVRAELDQIGTASIIGKGIASLLAAAAAGLRILLSSLKQQRITSKTSVQNRLLCQRWEATAAQPQKDSEPY